MVPKLPPSSSPLLLRAAPLVFLLVLGCKVGPDFRAPQADAGQGWTQPAEPGAPGLSAWWRHFGDPTLDRLEAAALAGNLDLRQAELRIQEARALRDAAAGAKYPTVQAQAGITREEQTLNGPLPISEIPGLSRDITIHDVGFDAAWELDLFGRVRRQVESAEAQAQAARESAGDVRISVAAEVARTYLTLRGAQRELAAQSAIVEAFRRTLETARRRAAAGDLAAAEVERIQGQFLDASAGLPGLRARMHAAALGLGALLGRLPESEAALAATPPPDIALAPIPVGERADILRRRPDVRAAERRLAGATADVGVAKAEWFPKLTISASAGYEALKGSQLFNQPSQLWSVAPFVSWRILDGGTIRAQIHASQARQEEAALAYESAVIAALTDAERALLGYRLALETTGAQRAALDSARRTYRHAEQRFQHGDIALMDLLDAERNLRADEDAYARSQTDAAIDLVALYKALGGDWS